MASARRADRSLTVALVAPSNGGRAGEVDQGADLFREEATPDEKRVAALKP